MIKQYWMKIISYDQIEDGLLKIGNGIRVTLTTFIEVAIRTARQKVERWKKLNSRQKYAYFIGELLGITFGIAFGAVLGWVNGRIAQNLYIGFIFGVFVFGPAFGKRLSRRYANRVQVL